METIDVTLIDLKVEITALILSEQAPKFTKLSTSLRSSFDLFGAFAINWSTDSVVSGSSCVVSVSENGSTKSRQDLRVRASGFEKK